MRLRRTLRLPRRRVRTPKRETAFPSLRSACRWTPRRDTTFPSLRTSLPRLASLAPAPQRLRCVADAPSKPPRSLQRRDPLLDREPHQPRELENPQLLHHPRAIGLDGLGRERERPRDLGDAVPFGEELEHLALAGRQALERIVGRA